MVPVLRPISKIGQIHLSIEAQCDHHSPHGSVTTSHGLSLEIVDTLDINNIF